MSMSASRQMHAVQTMSVTTLLDRTRVNVLQDILKTLPPRITWSRCVTVRNVEITTHYSMLRMQVLGPC